MKPPENYEDIRDGVRRLCAQFPDEYFRKIDAERGYPEEFVTCPDQGRLAGRADPAGVSAAQDSTSTEASVIMEEINRCGRQLRRLPRTDVRHERARAARVAAAEAHYLPRIATGELRLQSMAVTEPTTGTDTTKIKTTAVRKGDRYVVNGQKVWISRVQHSDLMLLLARTTPLAEVKRKSEGMSIFIVDLREAHGQGHDAATDPEHGESRDQRAVLRQSGDSCARTSSAKKAGDSNTFSMV